MAGNPTLPTENIDEVILGLLAYEPNEIDDLSYESYKNDLRAILIEVTAAKRKIGDSEFNLIKDEFKRIRGKKGRFRIKRTKISASGLGLGGIRKQIKGTQKRLMLAPVGEVPQQQSQQIQQETQKSPLLKISETLDSILETLIKLNKQDQDQREKKRLDDERKKRTERETGLESKVLSGFKKAIDVVTKPFQSIFDKIINFIFYTLLGKVVMKLIDWFADEKNQKKIQSLIRFFKDHWPTLLALYLRFGTGIGRFVGKLSRFLIKGAIKLGAITAQLALKAGLGKAGGKLSKIAGFLGGRGGRLLGAGLAIGADVAMTAGTSGAIEGLAGGETKVPGFSGGGWSGGIKNFFGNMFSGLVKGPKGTDKVPAMLTDGEFVMSAGAVKKYGVDTLEGMNAAGGGTNVPQVANGMTYAAGGGLVGRGNPSSYTDPKTGMMGGIGEIRAKYDAIHGPGSYDKKSAAARARANATPLASPLISLNTGNLDQLRADQRSGVLQKGNKPTVNKKRTPSRYTPEQQKKINDFNAYKAASDARIRREKEISSKAKKEMTDILSNPNHPLFEKADNDPNFFKNLRAKYAAQAASTQSPQSAYRAAGMGSYSASNIIKSQNQTTNGKYYSSSDQKTYANYNDALAARKSRMTSLASQQRLDKLSSQGAGPRTGRGVRYTAEGKAQTKEDIERGGTWGQLTRGLTRMFSDPNSKLGKERIAKLDAADRASRARVKQAGAASIGRYYSSSDGKYYKDYNAAKLAKEQRLKSGVKPLPKPKPKPYVPSGGGTGGRKGAAAASPKAPSPSPRHKAGTKTTERTTGTKR